MKNTPHYTPLHSPASTLIQKSPQYRQLYETFKILDSDNDGLITYKQMIQIMSEIQIQGFNQLSYKLIVKLQEQAKEKDKINVGMGEMDSERSEKMRKMINFQGFLKILQQQIGSVTLDGVSMQKEDMKNNDINKLTRKQLKPLFNLYSSTPTQPQNTHITFHNMIKILQRLGQPHNEHTLKRWLTQYKKINKQQNPSQKQMISQYSNTNTKNDIDFQEFYQIMNWKKY